MKQQANLVKALGGESLSSTVHSISINKGSWDTKEEQSEDKPSSMMLPYVAGVSERIRMACPIHRLHISLLTTQYHGCIPHSSDVYGKLQTWKQDILCLAISGLPGINTQEGGSTLGFLSHLPSPKFQH